MVTAGLYVRSEAKPGKEKKVDAFLRSSLPLVDAESDITAWFAIQIVPPVFGHLRRLP